MTVVIDIVYYVTWIGNLKWLSIRWRQVRWARAVYGAPVEVGGWIWLRMRPAGPKTTLPFPRLYIYIYMCIRTYHVCNNYVTYIVAMRPYFSRHRQFRRLLCVAAMSSLPQLQLRDGYREAEAT